jgi:hypothetical protein
MHREFLNSNAHKSMIECTRWPAIARQVWQ